MNDISVAQKTINTNLDYSHSVINTAYIPVVNQYIPFNSVTGNISVTNGEFVIKSGKTYEINIVLGYLNTSQTRYSNILYGLYIDKSVKLASLIPQQGTPIYELPLF